MKKFSLILLLALVSLISSCTFPKTLIINEGKTDMVVYEKEVHHSLNTNNLRYKYTISDDSGLGWTLHSNQIFYIGDTISISVR